MLGMWELSNSEKEVSLNIFGFHWLTIFLIPVDWAYIENRRFMPNSMNIGQEFVFKFTKFQNVSVRIFAVPGPCFILKLRYYNSSNLLPYLML